MSEPRIPQKSNGGKGKYEVVSEAEFNHRVTGGSRFNGFIVYPNKQYGFAVPLQDMDTIFIGRNQGIVIPQYKHFVFKPLREQSELDKLRALIKPKTPLERNPKNPSNQRNKVSTPSLGIVPNPIGIIPSIIESIPISMTIDAIFKVSGDKEKFDQNYKSLVTGRYVASDSITGMSSIDGYVSDSKTAQKANETNQWVNKYGVFYADDIEKIRKSDLTNYLLGCMIYGVGPENIVFPTNGTISSSLRKSGVVHDALEAFYGKNRGRTDNLISISEEFGGNAYNAGSFFFQGPLHPETFLGSANVRVQQKNQKQLLVEIFNITSLTSGDFVKHFDFNSSYPMSVVRDQLCEECENLQYGNVSQTYSFTIDIDFKRLGSKPSGIEKTYEKAKKILRTDEWFKY